MPEARSGCTPGYTQQWSSSCTPCSSGMTSNGGSGNCYCAAGSYKVLGISCSICNRTQYSDANATKCIDCPAGQISGPLQRSCITESECNVTAGFELAHSSCVCPPNKILSLDGRECVDQCGLNTRSLSISDTYQRQQYCWCENGYIQTPDNRTCIALSECGEGLNMTLSGYKCDCGAETPIYVPGEAGTVGSCRARASCSTSERYDAGEDRCIPCQENAESGGGQSATCACKDGFVEAADGSCARELPACDGPGQARDPANPLLCTCSPGFGGPAVQATEQGTQGATGTSGTPSTPITCTPCTDNAYKPETSTEPCKPCPSGTRAAPANAGPASNAFGPNTRCVPIGTCLAPACQADKSCSQAECATFAGCAYGSPESCTCDQKNGFFPDSAGGCVTNTQKAGTPVYAIAIGVVVSLLVLVAIIVAAVVVSRKKGKV